MGGIIKKINIFKENYKYFIYCSFLEKLSEDFFKKNNVGVLRIKKIELKKFKKINNLQNFFDFCYLFGINNIIDFLNLNFDLKRKFAESSYIFFVAKKKNIIDLRKGVSFFIKYKMISLIKLKIFLYKMVLDYRIIRKILII